MPVVMRMPEVITGISEAVLVQWMVEIGGAVTEGEPLAEVETDKAVVEYLAEASGTLAEQLVQPGQPVAVGAPIAVLAQVGESIESVASGTPDASGAVEPVATGPRTSKAAAPQYAAPEPVRRFATPLVRRLARERGIDLTVVHGSGPQGRIVRRDLDQPDDAARTNGHHRAEADPLAAESPPEQAPSIPPQPVTATPTAASGGTDIELTAMRRAIARRLTESKATVPHFYLQADCRADALLSLRRSVNDQRQESISLNDFVVKAVARAFAEVPDANAIWAGTTVRRFDDVDVGVAVAIDGGLVTPVLRDVGRKSVGTISAETRDLAGRARAGRLRQAELEGGSFCISNLGMYGIESFAAIINPPQAGILAVGTATQRPTVTDGELAVATVMTVTLSGDHRVFDGALAAQWLTAFVAAVERPLTLLV
jgi:pyruvate dehydrogenase E2 component (dihydrolipoyllysine-residue acetyltransferase)